MKKQAGSQGKKKPIVVNNRRGTGSAPAGERGKGAALPVSKKKRGWFVRLGDFFAREKAKILALPRQEWAGYIWDYYKLWIIGILFALFLIIYVPYRAFFAVTDFWLYAAFANTNAPAEKGSALYEDFLAYSGFDLSQKQLYFNGRTYFDPSKAGGTNGSYYQSFVAVTEAGDLDLVCMEEPGMVALGESGRLLDLSTQEIFKEYEDRFVYCVPYDEEYSKDPVPIGIDLSDSRLITEYELYPESCVLGVGAYSSRLDAVALFLEWALEGST